MTVSEAQNAPVVAKPSPHPGLGFVEFVILIAGLMAINGLAIDSMLPALPVIGDELGIAFENQRQWIITAYLLGFGAFQIVYGPLADRFGRKPILLFGVGTYALFSLLAAFSTSFEFMMVTRVIQGVGSAAGRVLIVAIVRDCYSGRQMAKVMSLAMIVFLAVPILAPSVGQAIMLVATWHWIFAGLAIFAALLCTWAAIRLPETLHPEDRLPIEIGRITQAFRTVLTSRIAVGYMLAMTLVLGALFGFINSAQQVFADIFDEPKRFTIIFALIALSMAAASFTNSRIVEKLGTRRVSHSALIGFVFFSGVNLITALTGHQTLISFSILQAATMFCFGLTGPNFGAMAMEPVGHVAGTASSIQGFVTTLGGAVLGFLIGQQFNGTTVPMLLGYMGLGALAILVVWIAEGKLFQPLNEPKKG